MNEQALATSESALDKRGKPRVAKDAPAEDEMFPVVLLRNYRPAGDYKVLGYHREAVTVKDAGGRWYEVEPARFVEGEMFPPITHGVGFEHKIWAGTHISVPRDEARRLINLGIAERADDV